ncbi:MAG: hypothetical protein L7S58_05720 [Acidimicrobiales bacterium]|nr:hypothetical protein [Acidimicrobiales bacterium]
MLSSPDRTLIAGTIVERVYGTYNGKRLFIMLIDGPPLSLVLEQDEETFISNQNFGPLMDSTLFLTGSFILEADSSRADH